MRRNKSLAAILMSGLVGLSGCGGYVPVPVHPCCVRYPEDYREGDINSNGMSSNPASEYCLEIGGTRRVEESDGLHYGICILPDGTEIREGELFCMDNPDYCGIL